MVLIFTPLPIWGGMAGNKRVRNLSVGLSDIFKLENLYIETKSQMSDQKSIKEIPLYKIDSNFKVVQYFKLLKHVRQRNKSEQVILYFYGSLFLYNFWIFPILKLIGVKVIIDIVEDYSLFTNYKNIYQKINYKTSPFLLQHIKHLCHGVVVISSYLENKLSHLVNGQIPVIKLPISVNLDEFVNKSNYLEGKLTFFYGGSFVYKDGVAELIEVFDRLCQEFSNIQLMMTGKGIKKDMDELKIQLKRLNNKRIEYIGFVSDEKYVEMIKNCQILCMPRRNIPFAQAGFPFKLGEYMITGNAVLASAIGELPEVFKNEEICFYNPEDLNDLYLKMKNLIINSNYRESIGAKGKEFALFNFDSKKHSKKLMEFVNQI